MQTLIKPVAFLDELNILLPGVARFTALPVLDVVIRQFCEASRAWTLVLSDMAVERGDTQVNVAELNASTLIVHEADLVDVLDVTLDGRTLPRDAWSRLARQGLTFTRPIAQHGVISTRVSVKPVRRASEYPEQLLIDHGTTLAHGTAYRLMMQPGQSWSDTTLAATHKALYDQGVNAARHDTNNQRQDTARIKHVFW